MKVPLVLKAGYGFAAGWAGQHSNCLYHTMMGIPGLKVALPSTPADAVLGIDGEIIVRHRGWIGAVWHSRNGRLGMIIVGVILVGGIIGLAGWTPYAPDAQNPHTVLKGISWAHLMGTDQYGRDVFSNALQGLGVSLEIAFLSVVIAGVIGTLGGIVAGFLGKLRKNRLDDL